MRLLLALAACLLAGSALAQDIRVIDGDTFEMDGEVIRLWGIDAPELDQTCINSQGNEVPFGRAAMATLMGLLDRLDTCETVETGPYGRTIARCTIDGGTDVGWLLVASGYAWDWPVFSDGYYADEEAISREAEAGIWRMDCIPPWEWRERN